MAFSQIVKQVTQGRSQGDRRRRATSGESQAIIEGLVTTVFLALAACGESPRNEVFHFREQSYSFPAAQVSSSSEQPHVFVRVGHPDFEFDLAYDSRSQGQHDEKGWPRLFSLNDGNVPNIQRYVVGNMRVICRKASSPNGGCGFRLVHRGIEWTVLFPEGSLARANSISERATDLLNFYAV